MAATRDKYLPQQQSERWYTPYITCSLVSWLVGDDAGTLGESVMWPNGKYYGKPALKNRFKKAWNAIKQDGDKGYGRTDFNAFMQALNSPIRLNDVKFTRDRDDILAALQKGNVITMAGNTRGCRSASPIRKWVGEADHRIAVKGYRVKDGVKQTQLYEPMTPDSDTRHWGKWIPVQDLFDFGKRFKHYSLFYAERFISGHWTREAKARRTMAKTTANLQARIATLTSELIEANKAITQKNERIEHLVGKVAELEALVGEGVDRAAIFLLVNHIEQDLEDIKQELTAQPIPA